MNRKDRIPSEEEQQTVQWYVLKRDIIRPNTDVKTVARHFAFYIVILILLIVFTLIIFNLVYIQKLLPQMIRKMQGDFPLMTNFLVCFFAFIFWLIIILRFIAVDLIKVYQHYADESFRRSCKFKPTCSEYAILAIKKYGFLIGSIKTYARLTKRCKGSYYWIDYP